MSKRLITLTMVVFALGFVGSAMAADTASANVTARLLSAIAITNSTPLNFGRIIPGSAADTVSIDAAAAANRHKHGTATLVAGGSITAASFAVVADSGTIFTLSIADSPAILLNGTDDMVIDSYTQSCTNDCDATEDATVYVGATLAVDVVASNGVGNYTDDGDAVDVVVAYN